MYTSDESCSLTLAYRQFAETKQSVQHAVVDRVPWLAYLMHKNCPSEVVELFMNAFPCTTASEESHHMSKFGSHYAKVDFGQNESHVIIYVYCTCAKTDNCLFDSLHAFLVIWAIRLIWVIRQSGFYTCPNSKQRIPSSISPFYTRVQLVIRLTSDSSTTVYKVLVYMCV